MQRLCSVLFVVAWTALLLPWERCHSDCHDKVLPSGHDCHTAECRRDAQQGTPDDAPADDPCDGGDHESIDFSFILRDDAAPSAPPPTAIVLPTSSVRVVADPPAAVGGARPPDLERTTVLLL